MKIRLNTGLRLILTVALVGTAVFCFFRSVDGNSPHDLLSRGMDQDGQGKKGSAFVRPETRTNLKAVRVLDVKDDGERFPGVGDLDQSPPIDAELLKELNDAGNGGSIASVLSRELKKSVLAGRAAMVNAVSGQLIVLGDKAVPDVMLLLGCGERQVESVAFSVLSRIGTAKALVALIGKTINTADSQYRTEMERQFASIQSTLLIDSLVNMMNESDQPDLRSSISSMLSSMEGGYVVGALVNAIPRARTGEIAREMTGVLSRLNKPSNTLELEKALSLLKEQGIQEAAAMALANIGNAQACEVLVKHSSDPGAGSVCRDWLATVSSPYGQQALLDIVNSDNEADVRMSAAMALGNYTSSDLLNTLQRLLLLEPDQQVKAAIQDSIEMVKAKVVAIPVETVAAGVQDGVSLVLERAQ